MRIYEAFILISNNIARVYKATSISGYNYLLWNDMVVKFKILIGGAIAISLGKYCICFLWKLLKKYVFIANENMECYI